MNRADKYRLLCIQSDLLDSVDASYVVDYLIEKEVLEPEDDDQIKAERTAKERTQTLIQILPNTTPDALKHLRQALLEQYGFIVTKLDSVQVPPTQTYTTTAGAGGLRTAAAAVNRLANQSLSTTSNTHTYNISGDDNFVIIGGNNTEINVTK